MNNLQCPSCNAPITEILAHHEYLITYNEEQNKWSKEDSMVVYTCGNCLEELDYRDVDGLEDVLKQVDEL